MLIMLFPIFGFLEIAHSFIRELSHDVLGCLCDWDKIAFVKRIVFIEKPLDLIYIRNKGSQVHRLEFSKYNDETFGFAL